jgi:lysophospholipase L1-like esterase
MAAAGPPLVLRAVSAHPGFWFRDAYDFLPMAARLRQHVLTLRSSRLLVVGALVMLLAVCGAAATAVTATGSASADARYYVALGDSLSTGYQPTLLGQGIETHSGYVNDIYSYEHSRLSHLTLVDLGCPGDTTTSLMTGVGNLILADRLHCDRSHGSQLGAVLAFLREHHRPGEVSLITIDIGINDLNRCAGLADPSRCLFDGEHMIATNLPRILHELRAAAPPGTTFAAMTLYDTYLGKRASEGATGANAGAFLTAYREANDTIAAADQAAGFRTADVAGAFATYDTAAVSWHGGQVPMNLARACVLTWSCSPAPIYHNIHPDTHGYRVIARAFEQVIGRLPQLRSAA